MIRMKPLKSAKRAEDYYGKKDGDYYDNGGLRRQWGGFGADLLGLTGLTPQL